MRRPKAKAIHARVDHHVARAVWSNLFPSRHLLSAVEARPSRQAQRGLGVVRTHAVQDDKADALRQVTQLLGLGPGRDEEVAAAGLDQRLCRLTRTEPVAVRLHRGTRRDARMPGKPEPVGLDCGTVDGETKGAVHRRRLAGLNPAEKPRPALSDAPPPAGQARRSETRNAAA